MKALPSLAGAALLAFAALPVLAQTPPAQPAQSPMPVPTEPAFGARPAPTPEMMAARRAMRASCAADMASLCADTASAAPAEPAQPGGQARGRMQCLRMHAAQLSVPCRQAMVAMRDARKAGKS